MLSVFSEYNAIKEGMANLIEVSGYRNDYLARKIGISNANFSVKKQRGSWTDKELAKLVDVLTNVNEDVEDLLMLQIVRSRKDEPTMSYEEYKKEVASWK
ncbi:hypothetical protein [Foetidibacter luteolus]|uniref:hypothetical protein n=1 Tax=Foetidibacter luteolus TaxID=2608880 RepID=UPI00129BEACA|nr:hypothetical protein [Foetidibacter luteolus]